MDVVTPPQDIPTLRAPASPAAAAYDPAARGADELDRQVQAYIELGVPGLTGLSANAFRDALAPLRAVAATLDLAAHDDDVPPDDSVPFVLVLDGEAVRPNDLVPAMRRGTRAGVSVIDDAELATYRPVDGVEVPNGFAYLLTGVDTGSTYVGVPPEEALARITAHGRTPLTIVEGIALVTVRPDMLRPNRCFSLAGSRTGTNQRVPAIWISERRPKLGWCWDRNPHTWLGTASATGRRSEQDIA